MKRKRYVYPDSDANDHAKVGNKRQEVGPMKKRATTHCVFQRQQFKVQSV